MSYVQGVRAPAPPGAPGSAPGLMPPPGRRPRQDDDAWVLPRRGVQQALQAAGLDKDFKIEVSLPFLSFSPAS